MPNAAKELDIANDSDIPTPTTGDWLRFLKPLRNPRVFGSFGSREAGGQHEKHRRSTTRQLVPGRRERRNTICQGETNDAENQRRSQAEDAGKRELAASIG